MDIQWYPGHMAKAKRLVMENLRLVDVMIEVLDARIPAASRNPDLDGLAAGKPRLVVLNKSDLADPVLTRLWRSYFAGTGCPAVAVDSVSGKGIREIPSLVQRLAAPKMASLVAAGRRPRAARCMVLGIPNVGKSFFINRLVGRRVTRTEDRPGVTKGQQWIRVAGNLDLMDNPGILWSKLDDPEVSFRLAVTGAIKEEVLDLEAIAGRLLTWLRENHLLVIRERYRLTDLPKEPERLLEAIGAKRGFVLPGGTVDTLKAAQNVLKEFREGKLGRFTFDEPGKD